MKPITSIPVAAALVITGLSFSFSGDTSSSKDITPAKGIAVLELFTSEGCSSCPPADEVAIRVSRDYPDNVYFLGFHVDYWDDLGWKDEFSNRSFAERQRKYAGIFNLNSIYTPQVIINGKKEMIGSRETELRKSIKEELIKEAPDSIGLNIKASGENIQIAYDVTAGKLLNIALVQLKASTNVRKGENRNHRLNHINIVRVFKTLDASKVTNGTISFSIPKGLTAKDVSIIAYLQDKTTFQVTGASQASIQN
ncbi:MAG: DUF1223 domain-containing protein [Chitinophagales bacterium]|nr:DUF1223 domain-containing protein [Chitinophagales bacterium]